MIDLEDARQRLYEELERQPHTRYDLLGNAACARKIRQVIIAYIINNNLQSTCVDEMKSLMIDSGVLEKSFIKEIVPYIDCYYKAKELIDAGYCDDLK